MISTCANPACNRPFHYLRGGRLYRFDAPCGGGHSESIPNGAYATGFGRCAVFFWLCRDCSSRLSLKFNGRAVTATPLQSPIQENTQPPIVSMGEWETDREEVAEAPKAACDSSTPTTRGLNTR